MKTKTIYTCQNCGAQFPKWIGRCTECGAWNSIVEETYTEQKITEKEAKGHALFKSDLQKVKGAQNKPLKIHEVQEVDLKRWHTSFSELDRVLGGGLVPGSLVLIGGDPGIGKSTILMQAFLELAKDEQNPILYITGEESASQVKLRATRLGLTGSGFYIFAENCLEEILENVKKIAPKILMIDSIQTIFSNQVQSAPGSVSQIRESTARLMQIAKTLSIATLIVGHVTKDGAIAGPKVLEHMVDTVLYFEGTSNHAYRILRAVKNRFGSTNEIGVFEMSSFGLKEVKNPSELFLQERPKNVSGTIVTAAMEGSRPILVEVQALVSASNLATPRRTTLGYDHNKVSLLIAVIEKKLGIPLYGHDIFVNIAGGIKLNEPSADLAIALSLISSYKNKAIDPFVFACGEIGLTSEVRQISQIEQRVQEAIKLGFKTAWLPKKSIESLKKSKSIDLSQIELVGVDNLVDALKLFE
jgi:DNA repair protein RadA/Sms